MAGNITFETAPLLPSNTARFMFTNQAITHYYDTLLENNELDYAEFVLIFSMLEFFVQPHYCINPEKFFANVRRADNNPNFCREVLGELCRFYTLFEHKSTEKYIHATVVLYTKAEKILSEQRFLNVLAPLWNILCYTIWQVQEQPN